ncbi:MAG: NAD+ synthase [Candidatus Peregrinibacteria bacterium]|nr:NAD+ synthase [Candidatus Peregrinibacteria bacterium]
MDPRISTITKGLKEFFEKAGFQKAVVGLSGGVDSALTAKFGVLALGKESVSAILMPYEGMSSSHSVEDAKAYAEELGIGYEVVPIRDFVENYQKLPWQASEYAHMNVQARARATILYHYANTHRALVLGTGNKTEETLGYFTKYGDGAVDVLPIGSLYKTEVWAMAKELGLPEAIINKAPSAELREGHTDEDEIGMSYAQMDEILQKLEAGGKAESELEQKIYTRIQANAHKSAMPPVIGS